MDIFSDDRILKVTAPNGDSILYNKEYATVTMGNYATDYGTCIKLVKALKKEINRASFSDSGLENYE